MKAFETPIAEIRLFAVEDILTASGDSDYGIAGGVGDIQQYCDGTAADYLEEECGAY